MKPNLTRILQFSVNPNINGYEINVKTAQSLCSESCKEISRTSLPGCLCQEGRGERAWKRDWPVGYCVTSSERNFCRYEGLPGNHGKRNSNPRLVGYREGNYVEQFNTTKLSGFVTIFFQWQMHEWLFLYVPLRYLYIFKHVLPETEDAW